MRTYSLGVLFTEESAKGLTHPFFAAVLNAFKIAAEARSYTISFINPSVGEKTMTLLEACRLRNYDGVCIICYNYTDPEVAELAASGIPCVTVDHLFRGIPAVLSDNETGVQKLVEYAISLGHTRIAFIHGHRNSIVTETRLRQFRQTMMHYMLPVPEDYVRSGQYSDIGLTRKLVEELLRLPERPTCILLPDDACYFGAQEAVQELGLSIPADLSVAGYDGISLTQAIHPRLTTVRQNSDRIGEEAATRLIGMIENPQKVSRLPAFVPVELLRGDTVTAPCLL